jgi:uncharacterized protein (TIGR00299 family) protein
MNRILFVDPIGGAAGDMLLAALIDAGAPLEQIRLAVDAVVPGRFTIGTEEVQRAGIRATALRLTPTTEQVALTPRSVTDLVDAVESGDLPERVKALSLRVLQRLGQAEASVHGGTPDGVGLYELGDDDTLVDVVGFAAALVAMDVKRVLLSALPLGAGGTVPGRSGHHEIPLPAPATLELLKGFPIRGAGPDETVTPTAAAILAALAQPADSLPDVTLEAVGYGAGTRDPADRPNVVRVLIGAAAGVGVRTRSLVVLEANLDDLTPELVADAASALFAAGALDVWTTPIHMKKGRLGVMLSALCELPAQAAVRTAFFEATSTFGVRAHTVLRSELERRTVAVEVAGGSVRVKVGMLGDRTVTATPEHDDVAELAHQLGRPVREVYAEAMAASAALRDQEAPRA